MNDDEKFLGVIACAGLCMCIAWLVIDLFKL